MLNIKQGYQPRKQTVSAEDEVPEQVTLSFPALVSMLVGIGMLGFFIGWSYFSMQSYFNSDKYAEQVKYVQLRAAGYGK